MIWNLKKEEAAIRNWPKRSGYCCKPGAFHAHLSAEETSIPWLIYTCMSTLRSAACFSAALSAQSSWARQRWQGWSCCISVFVAGRHRWTCCCFRLLVSSACTWCAARRLGSRQTRSCPGVCLKHVVTDLSCEIYKIFYTSEDNPRGSRALTTCCHNQPS